MYIPGNTPTHLILIDFSSTPDALFPGTALSKTKANVFQYKDYRLSLDFHDPILVLLYDSTNWIADLCSNLLLNVFWSFLQFLASFCT